LAFDIDGSDWNLAATGVADVLSKSIDFLVPPEKIDPVTWGERHREMSSKESARKGKWRVERTPWMRDILFDLSDESPVKILVCPKGAQIGFTEAGFIWTGWSFDQDPGTMITLWPTDGFIKRQIKQRVDPFLSSAEPMVNLFGVKKSRASASTLMQKSSVVGEWIFASAKSAANLRGIPAVRAMADEIDEAGEDLGDQGDVVDLLIGRLSDAGSRMKLFIPCTPTIESKSISWKWFGRTDKAYWEAPCPHCHRHQKWIWSHFKWPEGETHRIEYICEYCDIGFQERYKPKVMPDGLFVPTATATYQGAAGKHVSSHYAPLGSWSWQQSANQWVAAGGRESELKTFTNLRDGLPWRQTTDAPTSDQLEQNKEPYSLGILPPRCGALTFGGDVQGDRLEIYVWGFGVGLESWLVQKIAIARFDSKVTEHGEVKQVERTIQSVRDEIATHILDHWFERSDGARLKVTFGLIDVNFDTTWAMRLIALLGNRVGAVRGVGGADEDQGGAKQSRLLARSKVSREGVGKDLDLYRVSSPMAFSEFYRLLKKPRPEAGAELTEWEGFVHLPDEIDDAVLLELTCDVEVMDTKKGKRVWKKLRNRNEAGDCRKYARAALEAKGIAAWKPAHWQERFNALDSDAAARKSMALQAVGQTKGASSPQTPPPKRVNKYLSGN
jgi:phage terminase large subunit GpA-like protein